NPFNRSATPPCGDARRGISLPVIHFLLKFRPSAMTREENDFLTRTGPGTPMGELFRRYWIPALLADDLGSRDCTPVRVRLLCEDLVAFRDTGGKIALIREACPHRGASLFLGRNEEHGLRCVYHGWKFDVEGNCVDMPFEPSDSNFKSKIHANCYPGLELGG